jgi:DNA replication protein DnaC
VAFWWTKLPSKPRRVSRRDHGYDAEMCELLHVDLLIVDDLCVQAFNPLDTADIHDLIVECHPAPHSPS